MYTGVIKCATTVTVQSQLSPDMFISTNNDTVVNYHKLGNCQNEQIYNKFLPPLLARGCCTLQ